MELTDADIETLTYTLLGEARGEGAVGMYAVANVIRNRAESPFYPDNPAEVAIQPWQFSTNNGPNMGGGNQTQTRREAPKGSKAYEEAERIARTVFEGDEQVDVTGGALFYHARGVTPTWASSVTSSAGTQRIGNHVYYPRRAPPADVDGEVWRVLSAPRAASIRPVLNREIEFYTPTIEQVQAFDDLGNRTPIQFFPFGRIADKDFYGIRDRGIGSVLGDASQSPRRRIREAQFEQRVQRNQQVARESTLNTNTAALDRGNAEEGSRSEIIVKRLASAHPVGPQRRGSAGGRMVEAGNIDLATRPTVRNADGTVSTVRSISTNIDGREVLIPTVGDDGRILSDAEAIQRYRETGRHLGKFSTPAAATRYAQELHNQQDRATRSRNLGDYFQIGPNGKIVPRETQVGAGTAEQISRAALPLRSKPLTPAERNAIASMAGLQQRNGLVTAEGLAIRVVPLVSIGPDGQPILTPKAEPVMRSIPVGQTSSRGAAGAAARRVAAAKQEVRTVLPDLGYMRADTPIERENMLTAKPTGPTLGRGAVGAARRNAAQRLPAGMVIAADPNPSGQIDEDVYRITGPVAPIISTPVVTQRTGSAIKPGIIPPVLPKMRPPTITMPKVEPLSERFLEQVERIDAMPSPSPAPGAPQGAPFNVKKLLDGINAEARRISGIPPLPRRDPRGTPTSRTEIAPVPLKRPPGLGTTSSAGLVGGQDTDAAPMSPALRMETIAKPGKVSTQTVDPPKVPPRRPDSMPQQAPSVPPRRPDSRPATVSRSAPIAITVTGGRRVSTNGSYVGTNGYIYDLSGDRPRQVGRVNTGETPAQMYERLSAPALSGPGSSSNHWNTSITDSWNIPQSIV